MSSFLGSIFPQPAVVADGMKYAISGVLIGSAVAGVAKVAGDYIEHGAGIDEETPDLVHSSSKLLVRVTVAAGAFLLADRIMQNFGRLDLDPTGGFFFNAAFLFGQAPLMTAMAGVSQSVGASVTKLTGGPCCSDCAKTGGSCSEAKK